MKRVWPLVALGVGAYLVFAVITLPASLATARLAPMGVNTAGVEGTVWKGRAQVVQVANSNLGSVSWNLHVLALFTARLQADVQLTRVDGFARGVVTASASGNVRLRDVTASLPLSALPAGGLPRGWMATLNLKLADLAVEKGWPTVVEGTVEVVDLVGPPRRPANIGSYKLTFPAAASAKSAEGLVGALQDTGGPLQITGTLLLKPDRSYLLNTLIATRPTAPREVVDALQILGPPDSQGRRPFSSDGTL
jgi:general secretion pathway protein N